MRLLSVVVVVSFICGTSYAESRFEGKWIAEGTEVTTQSFFGQEPRVSAKVHIDKFDLEIIKDDRKHTIIRTDRQGTVTWHYDVVGIKLLSDGKEVGYVNSAKLRINEFLEDPESDLRIVTVFELSGGSKINYLYTDGHNWGDELSYFTRQGELTAVEQ